MARMMGGSAGKGRGLAGLDGAAQVGLIKQLLESLLPVYRYTLIARFSQITEKCPCKRSCCRGWRETDDWGTSVTWLADHVHEIGLTGKVGFMDFRRAVVAHYFGSNITFLEIARVNKVDRDTASLLNTKIVDYFRGPQWLKKGGTETALKQGVEWRARTEFEAKLKSAGLIE